MNTPDLETLETLTRDYAAFQSRKSGLATAIGGFLVLLLFWVAVLPGVFRVSLLQRPALEAFLCIPFLWLMLKGALTHWLYRGLGQVKAEVDPAYERKLSHWILGLALFLLLCQAVAIYGFVSGALLAAKPVVMKLHPEAPLNHPWQWLIWLPIAYLAPMPWAVRGIEEARAYTVLVGQCLLWLIPTFLFSFGAFHLPWNLPPAAMVLGPIGLVSLIIALAVLSPLAMIRGWKEHREYLALLRSLPRES